MAEAQPPRNRALFNEIGSTGLVHQSGQFLQEEYRHELRGLEGVRVYTEMSLTPVIGAILFTIEQMIAQVDWKIEPFSDEPKDEKAKEFVDECWGDMSYSWADTLSEISTMFTFGWAYTETVYKARLGDDPGGDLPPSKFNDRKIGWRKFALRGQNTLDGWDFDERGGIRGMIQQSQWPNYSKVTIPIEKGLLWRTRVEKNNPEGMSLLRRAYLAWWYVRRFQEIEAIGIERDLAGLPILKPPENVDLWNSNDSQMVMALAAAQKLVQSIRRGQKEGVLLPFGWELSLLASPSRRTFDINATITRYETRIAMSCLADFIFLGQGATGSWALSDSKTKMFVLALAGYLRRIKEVFNRHAIPSLLKLNGFDAARPPKLEHGDLETQNLAELAAYLTALSNIGAILFPDEALESHLRTVAHLPPAPDEPEMDEDGARAKIMEMMERMRAGTGKPNGAMNGKQPGEGGNPGNSDAE